MVRWVESRAAVERAVAAVADREDEVRAWAHLDVERALSAADEIDASIPPPPLSGIVLGVKDVIDTADHPTEYGSVIYAGHRPSADAAAVLKLRHAGAVCLGKTVTAELAMFHPGPTRNPHRPDHTPGGSSSGSAAAVAAGMADIALGTQTAGSVIRPASFCGVWGFKPTFGAVSVAGVKTVAPSLDAVGWFAASAEALETVRTVLTGRPQASEPGQLPRLALLRTEQWPLANADGRAALEQAARAAGQAGARVTELAMPPVLDGLAEQQPIIQAYEAARALAWERATHGPDLSEGLRGILDWGAAISEVDYDDVRATVARARMAVGEVFGDADVLLTPAVIGEAPLGLESTGDPRFARLWTLLGWPALSVPGLVGRTGMPVGVQLIARPGADRSLLGWGRWLGRVLG